MRKSNPWDVRTIFAFVGVHSEKIRGFIDKPLSCHPLDLAISEACEVELLIDSSIDNYAEPPAGLERRVLKRLAADLPDAWHSERN